MSLLLRAPLPRPVAPRALRCAASARALRCAGGRTGHGAAAQLCCAVARRTPAVGAVELRAPRGRRCALRGLAVEARCPGRHGTARHYSSGDAGAPETPQDVSVAVGVAPGGAPAASAVPQLPPWVRTMNSALDRAPVLSLLCFVALDIGSALCLWAGFEAVHAAVDADFALAYALSKAVRVQRLALDAAAAGALARAWPALAAVKVSRLVDAAAALPSRARQLLPRALRTADAAPRAAAGATPKAEPAAARRALSRTAEEARRMADAYGLAYMAAKNVIGPVSIALIYLALRQGLDVQRWLSLLGGGGEGAVGVAGRTAGRMALASWTSILFFPAVVLGAAHLALAVDGLLAARRRTASGASSSQSAR